MHALPRASLPHSRHSVSTTVQLFGADFARRTCFWAGIVDHVRPNPRPNSACRGNLNQPVLSPGYMSSVSHRCEDWRHSSAGSRRTSVWSVAWPTAATIASRRVNIVLLPTAVAVDVCGVMRREGKETGQMIEPHPQCSAYPQQQTSQLRLRKN